MFDTLTERLGTVFDRLKKRGALSADDVNQAMRDIRIALLEADVALPVVKDFINAVKEKAVGEAVIRSVTPGQMVVKIVHEHLLELLGKGAEPLNLKAVSPVVLLMVGLQGSGKTTTTGKLAKKLKADGKKVLMASLDVYRPAAQQQLATLGQQTDVASLSIVEAEKPLAITKRALQRAKIEGYDVLLLDTAGRLHVDEALMDEVKAIAGLAQPTETLLVADAMTGQDAVNVASAFKQALSLTGIILTRMDSDARGGAALSMRAVTGCPIKFVGMGEKLDALDVFHPERMADRILGMGDVVSLVEKAAATIAEDDAQRMAQKLQKGKFDLDDLLQQLKQMQKMGGLSSLMGYIPGLSGLKDKMADANVNDKTMKRQEAMLLSMTPQERKRPDLLNASRKRRIASGSGMTVPDVNRLLKQYQQMQTMMKQMSKMSQKKGGLMRQKLQHLLPR